MPLGRKSPTIAPDTDLLEHLGREWSQPVPSHPVAAPRTERRTHAATARTWSAQPTRATDQLDRLIAEGFMLLVWLAMWVLNAIFTVQGLGQVGVPWFIGVLIHFGISKGEHHLWKGGFDPIVLLVVPLCMLVDVGTTLLGLVDTLATRAPTLLGTLPADVWQWQALLAAQKPAWSPGAYALLVLAAIIALSSEYMIKKFWRRFNAVWNG